MKFMFAFAGWLVWTYIWFNVSKNAYDAKGEAFPFKDYFLKHWDDWLGSFLVSWVLMGIQHYGFGKDLLQVILPSTLEWSDSFILLSGPAYEILMRAAQKFKPTP